MANRLGFDKPMFFYFNDWEIDFQLKLYDSLRKQGAVPLHEK